MKSQLLKSKLLELMRELPVKEALQLLDGLSSNLVFASICQTLEE
jgi:hypothetical protein